MQKKIVSQCIFLIVTFIVLFVTLFSFNVSFGWFSSSKFVDATSSSVTLDNSNNIPDYYLATEGSFEYSEYTSDFYKYIYGKTNSLHTLTTSDNKTINANITSDNSEIGWALNSNSNMENLNAKGIQPGSSGSLEFYVVPTDDFSILNVGVNIEMTGYAYDTTYSKAEHVQSFINKHILLFASYEDGVYSGLINGSFDTTLTSVKKNIAYKITIYWVWPSVVGQLILQTGNQYLYSRHCILDSTTQEAIIADMEENFDDYYILSDEDKTSITSSISSLCVAYADSSFSLETLRMLNKGYNEGDQYIGEEAQFLCVMVKTGDNNE